MACKHPTHPDITWTISESNLALLWDDVVQRVIVYIWYIQFGLSEFAGLPDTNPKKQYVESVRDKLSAEGFYINNKIAIPFNTPPDIKATEFLLLLMSIIYRDGETSSTFRKSILRLTHYFFNVAFVENTAYDQAGNRNLFSIVDLTDLLFVADVNAEINNYSQEKKDFILALKSKSDTGQVDIIELDAGNYKFRDRDSVFDYAIPLNFLDVNGYDYILCDRGIHIAFPSSPPHFNQTNGNFRFREETFDLYGRRSTGQYAIMVPPEEGNASSIHSQLRTVRLNNADNNLEAAFRRLLDLRPGEEFDLSQLPPYAEDLLKKIIHLGELESTHTENCDADITLDPEELTDYVFREVTIDEERNEGQTLSGLKLRRKQIIFEFFYCLLKKCFTQDREKVNEALNGLEWHLSGSVFRRIANEMPRLKADFWLQAARATEAATVAGAAGVAAAAVPQQKIDYLNNEDTGCRSLFGSRLEISLPTCDKMYFAGQSNAAGKNHTAKFGDFADHDSNEIYIHAGGITFPIVGDGPSQEAIYASWKNGVAANPFFTDTNKTS